MLKQKSILTSILSYGTFTAATTLAMFALHLVAARYLGVEDFGRFSFAIAFVTLFAPLLDLGLYYLLIREVARKKELSQRYLSHTLTWKLICSPFVFVAIYLIVRQMHDSYLTIQIVCLMAVFQILVSWKDSFRPILLAHELFNYDAASLAFERFSLLIFVSLVLVGGQTLLTVGWVFVAVKILDLVIVVLIVQYKVCNISFGHDLSFLKRIVIDAVPIGAFYMTLTIYNYVDTVMLSALTNNQEVGWYSASYKIYEGPVLIPSIFATVFMPRLSRLFIEHKDNFISLFEQGLKYIVLTAVIVGANGYLLAESIVTLSFGSEYTNSIASLRILLVGLVFVFTITFLQTVMISVDRQKIILYVALLGLVLNVLFNAALIPLYGYIGAAVATISIEAIVCIVLCVVLHRTIAKLQWWNIWLKPVIVGVFTVAAVQIAIGTFGILIQVLLLNSLFVVLFFILGILGKQEIEAITSLITKNTSS